MAVQDPVAIFAAPSHTVAELVRHLLIEAGVDAYLTEDLGEVERWPEEASLEEHKYPVWVAKTDAEQAVTVLQRYAEQQGEMEPSGQETPAGAEIEMICEECSGKTLFPAAEKGTVQTCYHCGAFMDVGEEDADEEEWLGTQEEEEEGMSE